MKILLGMSGGVDSSFAAKLLLGEGADVEGAMLVMHEYTDELSARQSADEIGVKLNVIDVKNPFNIIIKENFVSEYSRGRTPNPCIICNERVKFKYLLDYALANGFDKIATGHYADVVTLYTDGNLRYAVKAAKDPKKDQSYMLYRLPQDVLSHLVLPLAQMTKDDLRQRAVLEGLFNAEKKDSQEICFLPDGGYAEYVESVLGAFPEGDFVTEDGKPLGRHKGIIRYTVGQRKGLGISLGERAFVTEIDPVLNTVTLSTDYKGREELTLSDVVFSGLGEPEEEVSLEALVRVRYSAPLVSAKITLKSDRTAKILFEKPVKASKGQSAVIYNSDGVILAGGFID